ncbi:MAG: MlaD family protein [Solirubrobacteraceae bacterium]
MSARTRAIEAGAAVVALVIVIVVLTSGGGSSRLVRLIVAQDPGLISGSDVRVGGVPVGTVDNIGVTPGGQVELNLAIRDNSVHLHPDASAQVQDLDLLGQKYVELNPGTASTPIVESVTIPAARVTTPTDLDQVLNVLDPSTRDRLAILINAAGTAVAGRHVDFSRLLGQLPSSLAATNRLLTQVVSDNHTLADVITHSDSFLATVVSSSGQLQHFVNSADSAAATFATRTTDLRATLARAPSTLSTLRTFLTQLGSTAAPLGPAARNIAQTAPQLTATLAQLQPFRSAVDPVLTEATAVAPSLGRLGVRGTPVIRAAVPTLASLDQFAGTAAPLMSSLGVATPGLLGVLEGWGRAIQGRDARGHMFHGKVTVGASFFQDLLAAKVEPKQAHKRAGGRPIALPAPAATPAPAAPAPGAVPTGIKAILANPIGAVGGLVGKLLGGILHPAGGPTNPTNPSNPTYPSNPANPSSPSSGGPQSLQNLLGYLLRR